MAAKEIKARAPKLGKEVTALYDFGETPEETIAKFGAAVVVSGFIQKEVITIQGMMRNCLEAGLDAEAIQDKVSKHIPGVAAERVAADPVKQLMRTMESLPEEERAAYIEKLKADLGL